MMLSIKRYFPHPLDYHECFDEHGVLHRVDLVVNGDFNEQTDSLGGDEYLSFLRSLVGKTVEVDYLYPHQEIAMNVRVIE